MKKRLIVLVVVLALAMLLGSGTPGHASASISTSTLSGTTVTINTNPNATFGSVHVSGDWVSYSDAPATLNYGMMHYHNLVTNGDGIIPNYDPEGGVDFGGDISGTLIAYNHSTYSRGAIDLFDVSQPSTPPVELAAQPNSVRDQASIGGHTVAWQDWLISSNPQIVAYTLDTQAATPLSTSAPFPNRDPAVSPDGSVVVWMSQNGITNSQIWEAVQSAGGWSVSQVGSSDSPYSTVDTDGQVIVYDALRIQNGQTTRGIYWQPVGGGQEQEVPFPAGTRILVNPHVSGNLISFENFDPTLGYNLWVYSLTTQTLYQVPNTTLGAGSDISVTSDGVVRVVWVSNTGTVYGLIAQNPTPADTTPPVLSLPGTQTVDATSPAGTTVSYTVSATDPDNTPGQITITCAPPSGSPFAIGTTTVTCQASDLAGNQSSGSFQVVVKGASVQISDLINLVMSFNLKQGIQNSLDVKLQSVQAALAAANGGDLATACSDLGSFINETQAQSGKALTVDQANQLIAAATQIKAVLGC